VNRDFKLHWNESLGMRLEKLEFSHLGYSKTKMAFGYSSSSSSIGHGAKSESIFNLLINESPLLPKAVVLDDFTLFIMAVARNCVATEVHPLKLKSQSAKPVFVVTNMVLVISDTICLTPLPPPSCLSLLVFLR
jgi:hypothetical protein